MEEEQALGHERQRAGGAPAKRRRAEAGGEQGKPLVLKTESQCSVVQRRSLHSTPAQGEAKRDKRSPAEAGAVTNHPLASAPSTILEMNESENKILGSGFLEFKLNYSGFDIRAGDFVSSEDISAGGHLWNVYCYPHGDMEEDTGEYVSVFVELTSGFLSVTAIFQVFLLGRDGIPSFSHEKKFVHVFSGDHNVCGWDQFLKRSLLESIYLSNGWVTFMCSIIVLDAGTVAVPPSNMGRDIGLLLDSNMGTDVSVIVKGETIRAHRAILAARSQVFQAKLFGPMAGATSSSITLQDIEPATFKAMLGFMYTDELPEDEFREASIEMMKNLLAAADRYGMDRLKLICAHKLWLHISEDTFAPILVCAETYNCPELKSKCFDYFAMDSNLKNIIFTDGFLWLLQKYRPLAAELKKRVGM